MFHRYDASGPSPVEQDYLQHQLEIVSRSFALVVPCVEPPARHYLATAYLLCRVVDNIEDCTQPPAWKDERFGEFIGLLGNPGAAAGVLAEWGSDAWPGLTEHEAALMQTDAGLPLWRIYARMPAPARGIVQRWTTVMAQGMRQLGDPERGPRFVYRDGVEVLQTETDYESYCYFVAGTVGSMASDLVVQQYGLASDVAEELSLRAESCGRGLQKTNILKDFAEDVTRGACYLPDTWLREAAYRPLSLGGAPSSWTRMVIADVLNELREATEYVLTLPYHAVGYRRASLLCLLPAYETLALAAERQAALFTAEHLVKISKPAMARCIVDSQRLLSSNDAIRRYSRRAEASILARFDGPAAESTPLPSIDGRDPSAQPTYASGHEQRL